jgi:hypothetical protein
VSASQRQQVHGLGETSTGVVSFGDASVPVAAHEHVVEESARAFDPAAGPAHIALDGQASRETGTGRDGPGGIAVVQARVGRGALHVERFLVVAGRRIGSRLLVWGRCAMHVRTRSTNWSRSLERLPAFPGLVEKNRGVFYVRLTAFIHFHEDPSGLHADVRRGSGFSRFRVETEEERDELLTRIREGPGAGTFLSARRGA